MPSSPLFVIALHFNFLQNLDSHHHKLMKWKAAHGGKVERSRIQAFLFDFATMEEGSQFDGLVRAANSLLVVYLAPLTLSLLLIRFSDVQNGWMTVWHTFWLCMDCWLVFKFQRGMRENRDSKTKRTRGNWLKWVVLGFWVALMIFEIILTLLTVCLDSGPFVRYVLPFVRFVRNEGTVKPLLSLLVPHIEIDPSETVGSNMRCAHIEKGDLSDGYFERVDLSFANLEETNMSHGHFKWSKMRYANIEKSDLSFGDFAKVDLSFAILVGANVRSGHFEGSKMRHAHLHGVDMSNSYAEGIDMSYIRTEKSNFSYSRLGCD